MGTETYNDGMHTVSARNDRAIRRLLCKALDKACEKFKFKRKTERDNAYRTLTSAGLGARIGLEGGYDYTPSAVRYEDFAEVWAIFTCYVAIASYRRARKMLDLIAARYEKFGGKIPVPYDCRKWRGDDAIYKI